MELNTLKKHVNCVGKWPDAHINPKAYLFEQKLEQQAANIIDKSCASLWRNTLRQDDRYRQYFGLCILLGVTNIYDIGCGFDFQVGYIANLDKIAYTGIDRAYGKTRTITRIKPDGTKKERTELDVVDFSYYNTLFQEYNNQITFLQAEYPIELYPKPHNAAIAIGIPYQNQSMEKILSAMARDFERVIVQVETYREEEFRKSLQEFILLELHEYSIQNYSVEKPPSWKWFFGTKFPEEISYLKTVGYNFYDIRFFVENVNKERYVNNIRGL